MAYDHRYADGAQGGLVMRRFEKLSATPEVSPDVFTGG